MAKHLAGKMTLSMPKCPVSMQMKSGQIILRCPECKALLYAANGSPHEHTKRVIEKHVKACKQAAEAKKQLEEQAAIENRDKSVVIEKNPDARTLEEHLAEAVV